jgi:alanine dehydrogenase
MSVKILRREEYRHTKHFLEGKDILINAIAWPASERKDQQYVVRRDMLKLMNRGAIILDLSVDFPSPIETCKPTTLSNPWYLEEGVIHISIYGYPGLVPVSCTERYSKQVLPIVLTVADSGLKGLSGKGELGKYISKAIVDPKKKDWEKYEPAEQPPRSLIE